MEEIVLLLNMALILAVSATCTALFKYLKIPLYLGYLAAGIILANYWSGVSEDTDFIVEMLADMGLVMLMFSIGLQFNTRRLKAMGGFGFLVVLIMVPFMISAGYIGGRYLGYSGVECVVLGSVLAGSSSAIFVAISKEFSIISDHEVQRIVMILVLEAVAQMLILSFATPFLQGTEMNLDQMVWMFVLILLFIVLSLYIGLNTVPRVVDWLKFRGYSSEIILVLALGLSFAMALLSVYIGLSMAIGAFLMGVIITRSKATDDIAKEVEPMKNIFIAMFFISIGLQITPVLIVDNIRSILVIFVVFVVFMTAAVFISYFVGNRENNSAGHAWVCAISVLSMSEFAFIIAKQAYSVNIFDIDIYASIIGAAMISMITLPLFTFLAGRTVKPIYENIPSLLYKRVYLAQLFFLRLNDKLKLAGVSTRTRVRRTFAAAYVYVILLVGLVLAFYLLLPTMTDFLFRHIAPLDRNTCAVLILVMEFLIALVPLYPLVNSVRRIEHFFAGTDLGTEPSDGMTATMHRAMTNTNIWIIVLFLDFLLILPMPSNLSLTYQFVAVLLGIGFLGIIYMFQYLKRD